MVCVHCSSETHIINSRLQKRSNTVWRRRKCLNCRAIFTTQEAALYGAAWRVHKKNKRLHPFSRDKLFLSLYKSLQHRKTATEDAGGLVDTVIAKLIPLAQDGLVEAAAIAQVATVALTRFDKAASVHYQAFHQI